jgi:hypothetical protein
MEKGIVMVEIMLEENIIFDKGFGNVHVARHGLDPLIGNTTKGIVQSHSSPPQSIFLYLPYTRILKSIATNRKEGFQLVLRAFVVVV